jgi:uncharacterized YccA/Bax inhibitor family protein
MLVGHHLLLLRDFEPCGIIFMNVCVVITVIMVEINFYTSLQLTTLQVSKRFKFDQFK